MVTWSESVENEYPFWAVVVEEEVAGRVRTCFWSLPALMLKVICVSSAEVAASSAIVGERVSQAMGAMWDGDVE